MGDLMLSVGGRWSDNSVYGSFFAPRASLLWTTTENVTLRASYGRGFRAPSINELYIDFPNTGVGYIVEGEPSLQPETSTGYNLGLQYAREDLVWFRVNAYYNQLTNLIDYFVKGTEPIVLSYRNIDEAVTRGVDVDVDLNLLDDMTIGLGYAWTVAQDGDGADLPFRTPHSVTWRITHAWEWAGLRTHLRGRWFDRQLVTDEQINLSIYSGGGDAEFFYTPSHMILDLKLVRPLFDVFELSAGINNITRQIYYPFGQIKGREYFAGLTWTLR
jgi:outer membrane receptor for ferrienterochelin and colicins